MYWVLFESLLLWCPCPPPPPLPLPLQVLSTISGCTIDQGISIYKLMKKVGQHSFGEKNMKWERTCLRVHMFPVWEFSLFVDYILFSRTAVEFLCNEGHFYVLHYWWRALQIHWRWNIHRKLLQLHGVLCVVHLNWPWWAIHVVLMCTWRQCNTSHFRVCAHIDNYSWSISYNNGGRIATFFMAWHNNCGLFSCYADTSTLTY